MPRLKPTWNAGKTTNVRVPESKKLYIKTLLRTLDQLDWQVEVLPKDTLQDALSLLRDTLATLSPKPRSKDAKAYREAIIEVLSILGDEPPDQTPEA